MVSLTYESTGSSQNRGNGISTVQKEKSERTTKMKKAMFGIAALAAATSFAAIESSNIVGYGPSELNNSGMTAAASFIPVTGNVIDATDLTVIADDDVWGTVNLQTLTTAGGTDESYLWYNVPEEGYYGWYSEEETLLEKGKITFQPGEGLWIVCEGDGYAIQSAGQVPTAADITVKLNNSGLSVANPTPVPVDAINTYITSEKDEIWGTVNLQTLTTAGGTDKSYLWYDVPEEGYYGWYSEEEELLEEGEIVVKPGQGLWIVCEGDGYNFVWPKVEL